MSQPVDVVVRYHDRNGEVTHAEWFEYSYHEDLIEEIMRFEPGDVYLGHHFLYEVEAIYEDEGVLHVIVKDDPFFFLKYLWAEA